MDILEIFCDKNVRVWNLALLTNGLHLQGVNKISNGDDLIMRGKPKGQHFQMGGAQTPNFGIPSLWSSGSPLTPSLFVMGLSDGSRDRPGGGCAL